MLTKKQYELLMFINDSFKTRGICPSYEEMKTKVGLRSKSGIYRLITELEERKFLKKLPNKARALEIIALPAEQYMAPEKIMNGHKKKNSPHALAEKLMSIANDNALEIPLYGKIACGTPIEAIRNPEDTVCVPAQMMGIGEHYALTCEGDSMKDAGIMDGDTVIIKRTDYAENGSIVVALVDGYEVTLKRFFHKGNRIVLEPANPAYETRILEADRVEIQGRLVGLMRRYN